ncbi:unknown [Clostridium sp. CAG:306]|nr:unknown [Clostridium sp. CAG:306]
MNKPKRIKIARIENKILSLGCKLSRIESLSKILFECLAEKCDITTRDTESLCNVLCEEIKRANNKISKIESLFF